MMVHQSMYVDLLSYKKLPRILVWNSYIQNMDSMPTCPCDIFLVCFTKICGGHILVKTASAASLPELANEQESPLLRSTVL